jgi:hypothetical protein
MDGLKKIEHFWLVGKFPPFLECESSLLFYQNPKSDPTVGQFDYVQSSSHTHNLHLQLILILSFPQQLLSNIQIIDPCFTQFLYLACIRNSHLGYSPTLVPQTWIG